MRKSVKNKIIIYLLLTCLLFIGTIALLPEIQDNNEEIIKLKTLAALIVVHKKNGCLAMASLDQKIKNNIIITKDDSDWNNFIRNKEVYDTNVEQYNTLAKLVLSQNLTENSLPLGFGDFNCDGLTGLLK